ncbi:MAG: tRNA-(ms[2]io[6]A)-hydroxylase [Bdellovibrionales bacterium]|nr:tRNA-(ms[2]io[6]A)-hydroxylase [Bdellovibrionales bacterium]
MRMFSLRHKTPLAWAHNAILDMDALLLDHAACERKAAAMGMSFVVKYPDRLEIIDPLIHFAREELEHFQQVCRLLVRRGLVLDHDEPDRYVNLLHKKVRTGRDERFLDRLVVAAVIEARGTERLGLVTDVLEDPELKALYRRLTRAEDRHKDLFLDLATHYFEPAAISDRLSYFLDEEAIAIQAVPFRSAIH